MKRLNSWDRDFFPVIDIACDARSHLYRPLGLGGVASRLDPKGLLGGGDGAFPVV